jgi:hypothetical protein
MRCRRPLDLLPVFPWAHPKQKNVPLREVVKKVLKPVNGTYKIQKANILIVPGKAQVLIGM